MTLLRAIRRFASNAWLVATPLVVLAALVGALILFGISRAVLKLALGAEEADTIFWGVAVWISIALVAFAPIGVVVYAVVCLVRWRRGNKKP